MAATAVSSVGTPVISRNTECGAISLANFSSSTPLVSGMRISEMMMSKICDSRRRRAAAPVVATSTRWPSLRKVISSSSQMDFSSSITRIWAISPLCPSRHSREFDDELRALIFLRSYADAPAVRLHDLVDDSQAQARASGKARLQGLKDLGALLRIEPDAGIAKANAQPEGNGLQSHSQDPACGHGA